MFVRILSAGLCLLLMIGCAKRGAKTAAPANNTNEQARASAPPATKDDKKAEKEDEPNWLKDDRFKDKKDQLPADGPTNGKQPWNVGPPQGGFTAPVPGVQPMPVPGGPGPNAPLAGGPKPPAGGVLQPTPIPVKPPPIAVGGGTPIGAANKLVAMADMREVWIFIENASGASGKMPSAATAYAALVEAKSPAAALVKDGAIILTGANQRESVWAFEARAYLNGGLVVSQNGVETLTAAELKARLGK